MNGDLCSCLLDIGRQDKQIAKSLAKWIPRIRECPIKIHNTDDLSWLPDHVVVKVQQALSALSANDCNKYEPLILKQPTIIDPEFKKLALTLPKELRLRIFGYTTQCHYCRKRLCSIDTPKIRGIPYGWLIIDGKQFCSRRCYDNYEKSRVVDSNRLINCLVMDGEIISIDSMYCEHHLLFGSRCRCWW